MVLDPGLRRGLALPVICPPMFLISGPDLVRAASAAGLIAVLQRYNARSHEQFVGWLADIRHDLDRIEESGTAVGALGVNVPLSRKSDPAELRTTLEACATFDVSLVISASGDPTELVKQVHNMGGIVFHDVTTIRFAEKAIAAGVDGLICIGAGGGGHAGTLSHLSLVPKVRSMFDGTIVAAGAIATGAAVRAAEVLGADLSYLGTRFIATQESMASDQYKEMLVGAAMSDVRYLAARGGVPANWLGPSLERAGVDASLLDELVGGAGAQLPEGLNYWAEVWSAGHGVELIDDVPTVADLVSRLRREYVEACKVPDMRAVARLVNIALES